MNQFENFKFEVNRHKLSGCFSWSAVMYSSAGSHGSFQLHFSVFAFAYQLAVCVFKQFSLLGFESLTFWGFLATVVHVPPPHPPSFFPSLIHSLLTEVWNGGSWLGCGDLPAMGAVFYLGAGCPQWKPLDIPGTHVPLK